MITIKIYNYGNTYTQMNVHAVLVKGRGNYISSKWRDKLFKYIVGTLKGTNNYSLAVGGCKDHVHVFFELNPTISVSDVLKNMRMLICLNFMNKGNNIVPTGLWLLLHYGYYQNIVPLALYKLAELEGCHKESY